MNDAPTRATTFPADADGRKRRPVASGVLDYFPDALVAIAEVSWRGNEQHNPGTPLHWDRAKSTDEADALLRHFLERGALDTDGLRHSAKMAWRALALLQKEIEADAAPQQTPCGAGHCHVCSIFCDALAGHTGRHSGINYGGSRITWRKQEHE